MAGKAAGRLSPDEAEAEMVFRAAELARVPPAPPHVDELLEVVTFNLTTEWYALETRYVREVVHPPEITPVPGMPAFLAGVVNLRGSVLAVVDLARVWGAGGTDERPCVVVLGGERAEFGLSATAVGEVTMLAKRDVLSAAVSEELAAFVRGVTGGSLVLLDGAALLADSRFFFDEA
jgi:purine-binding chemotaxis protein CheW